MRFVDDSQLEKIVDRFVGNTDTLTLGLVLTGLVVLATLLTPRRRVSVLSTGLSVALVLTLTVVQPGGWQYLWLHDGGLFAAIATVRPHASDVTAWTTSTGGLLNVLLFVPLGVSLMAALGKTVPSVAISVVLSYGLEIYQATLTSRVGSFEDVVANTVGATLGTAAAAVFSRRRGRARNGAPVVWQVTAIGTDRLHANE